MNFLLGFIRYHFWFELGEVYSQIPSDVVFDSIWNHKRDFPLDNYIFHPTSPLVYRFASDAESDHILAPYSIELRSRLNACILQEFLAINVALTYTSSYSRTDFLVDANLIAHCANLGYIEETAIRNPNVPPAILNRMMSASAWWSYKEGWTSVIDQCFHCLSDHRRCGGMISVSKYCQGA